MKGYYPAYAEPSHPVKGGKEGYTSRTPSEPCPVCGVIIRKHEKCDSCRCLIGRNHSEVRTYDGLCESCITRQQDSGEVGAAMVRIAIEENKQWA